MCCTQRASLSGRAGRALCVLNQPIELHLTQRSADAAAGHEEAELHIVPKMVLQVLRVDSWDRHTLHGYSFVDLPQVAGQHKISAKLWAPVGTISQQLNAKLCGRYLPLASPHLVAWSEVQGRGMLPRNRAALRTQSTAGVVHVRLQVVLHRPTPARADPVVEMLAARPPRSESSVLSGATPEILEGLRQRRRQRREARAASAGASAARGGQ
mmetsp:Transcript_68939/g.224682  ORF Transcript_68939/g.224682 Transcript_68939/m.224682 type:complete len:212 (+) Transcript_68939:160-795(+)